MASLTAPRKTQRVGFHYFHDDLHYRASDLAIWLPQLQTLGASWITLVAPAYRSIPEFFIRGLLDAGIEPIVHFQLPLDPPPAVPEIRILLETYARWGVRYAVLFDRPNLQGAWQPSSWAQKDLVERFLDRFLPFAEAAAASGLTPVFPPLEPGGDYWDTAFLQGALHGMQRRGHTALLDQLVLSAYAVAGSRRLDWGAGGPERWPQARPYDTPIDSEDQRGFRIFEWYLTLARTVIHRSCPIILLGAGCRPGDSGEISTPVDLASHAQRNLALAKMLAEGGEVWDPEHEETLEPIPDDVLAGCFWLLSAEAGTPQESDAWFRPDGTTLPVVGTFWQWLARRGNSEPNPRHFQQIISSTPVYSNNDRDSSPVGTSSSVYPAPTGSTSAAAAGELTTSDVATSDVATSPEVSLFPAPLAEDPQAGSVLEDVKFDPAVEPEPKSKPRAAKSGRPINHYLLLPLYDWGVSDWHLEVIRPFVRKYQPTIGYSLEEASLARQVTVIGGPGAFAGEKITALRQAGCLVEEIGGDGTDIASQLANL